jgi:hypothetical protein
MNKLHKWALGHKPLANDILILLVIILMLCIMFGLVMCCVYLLDSIGLWVVVLALAIVVVGVFGIDWIISNYIKWIYYSQTE